MSEHLQTPNPEQSPVELPHAGHFHDNDAYNCETEKLDKRKVKVGCPECKRKGAPLCSSKTTRIRGSRHGFDDWGDYHTLFETECRCGQKYRFTVVSEC